MLHELELFISYCFKDYPKWGGDIIKRFTELPHFLAQFDAFLSTKSITDKSRKYLQSRKKEWDLHAYTEMLSKNGIQAVSLSDQQYPELLKEIPDPPVVLYAKGNLKHLNYSTIAVVGPRDMTDYGYTVIEALLPELSRDFVIVSGLAKGVDAKAHRVALEQGGSTIAVLGTGVDVPYPKANTELYNDIVKNGLVISEYPPGTPPIPRNFPQRNRIISGLCLGTLVIEASEKSGSLITANLALDQNRDVFAVPGSIFSKQSVGVHNLIKSGAKCVTSAEDIKSELQYQSHLLLPEVESKKPDNTRPDISIPLTQKEEKIAESLASEALNVDQIIAKTKLDLSFVLQSLTLFEMNGLLKRLPGNKFKIG